MIGVIIIFVGVMGIGFWISDLGSPGSIWNDPKEMYENLGNNVLLIGIGGIILAVSYLIQGVGDFLQGKYETSKPF